VGDKQCFAYHVLGERCELEPGHDGDHKITTTWTSDESWTPLSVPYLPEEEEEEEEAVINATEFAIDPGNCFACNHAWHDERCPLPGCGCLTAVA
jgi:hypothetical protein